MCEYVDGQDIHATPMVVPPEGLDVGGLLITKMAYHPDAFWECWHPETDSWEAMYPPPEGMALSMTPGSKIRLNTTDEKPEHTKNPPPPEKTPAGTQMRDLIPK